MSFSRFSDGDVYTFFNTDGQYQCCGCILQETEWVDDPSRPIFKGYLRAVGEIVQTRFDTAQGLVDHLALHIAAGHDVPDYVVPAILADGRENGGA